jgi:hypothetical protein
MAPENVTSTHTNDWSENYDSDAAIKKLDFGIHRPNSPWLLREAAVSTFVALAPDDLIFTGTPKGVAALQPSDGLEGYIDGLGSLSTHIV